MKQVTIQTNGQLGFLGRLSSHKGMQSQINGHDSAKDGVDPVAGNVNGSPLARPETGLLGTTRIATPTGPVAVQELAAGDFITDAHGRSVAITHILRTPLTKTAICVRAPYYGLDQDMVIGANHRIAVTSDIAEYLFGEETVLVPAWAIKDGRKALHWETPPKTHLYQFQLESLATIKVGNCVLESMPKSGQSVGKLLSNEEARCFASEHKSGYQN